MSRKVLVFAALILLCSMLFASCGVSKEKSIDIALKSLGLTRVYTPRNDSELDKSAKPEQYKVTVWTEEQKYVVRVDKKSGTVLKTETLPLDS